MTWALALFEVRKSLFRLSTWVYFLLFGALACFFMLASANAFEDFALGTGTDKLLANSPFHLHRATTLFSSLGVPLTGAIFGQALLQDVLSRTEPLFFTLPIRKPAFLLGRFLGSLLVMLVVFSSIPLGLFVGTQFPSVDPDMVGPTVVTGYAWPLLVTVAPNVLLAGGITFSLAALTRRMTWVYVANVVMLVGYMLALPLSAKVENQTLAGMVDPFGGRALKVATQYWTISEKNTLLAPVDGILLANRAAWLGLAALLFLVALWRFRFQHAAAAGSGKAAPTKPALPLWVPTRPGRAAGALHLLLRLSLLDVRETLKNTTFLVMALAGVAYVLVTSRNLGLMYGTATYPVTWMVLEVAGGGFSLFMLIILTYQSGELVWRERDAGIHQVLDALPVRSVLPFLAKVLALLVSVAVLLGVVALTGVFIQWTRDFTDLELGLYAADLGMRFLDFALAGVLALCVQSILQHKVGGHVVMVVYYVGITFLPELGLEDHLYRLASTPPLVYSDMNGFGGFLEPVAWLDAYWACACVLLSVAAHLLWARGTDTSWKVRLALARQRFTTGPRVVSGLALTGFLLGGAWIFYNTHVLNPYRDTRDEERAAADYEKLYKSLAKVPQPRITAVTLRADFRPEEPGIRVRTTATLENKTDQSISTIYVDAMPDLPLDKLTVSGVTPSQSDALRGFWTVTLKEPLAPGATTTMEYDVDWRTRGFKNGMAQTRVVGNGTFVTSELLPGLGYRRTKELEEDAKRRRFGLAPRERMADLDDVEGRRNHDITSDSDWMRVQATVCTSPDQVALAPGTRVREWTEDGRRCFHYATDAPVLGFFALLSGRYAVREDTWNGTALEIYYHPSHTYDLDRMFLGMKKALEYASTSFSPFPHRQLRIVEIPRYAEFAQSFPGLIPYSEGIGFIARVDPEDPEDVDYPFYVTAHEVAHQWWGHQLAAADVQGATLLSESLSQYTAMMVMKKEVGALQMRRFLRYELDHYLQGRGSERKKELPLLRVENQPYIHYNKGSLVTYALADLLGEERVNQALRSLVQRLRFQPAPYPTSRDLLAALRAVTPPDLQYALTDMLETITLHDNRAVSATCKKLRPGKYEVRMKVALRKLRAGDLGEEQDVPVDDVLDVGATDEMGKFFFMERRRLQGPEQEVVFTVNRPAWAVGVDPLHKLVDRVPLDNLTAAGCEDEAGN